METELRKQLTDLGAFFYQRRLATGTAGNLSARLPDNTILVTPTNTCLGRLDPDSLSKVHLDGSLCAGASPTKELPLHLTVYRHKPKCNAIIHLHPTFLTALSCMADIDPENVIRPFTPYYVLKVAKFPLIPYHRPGSSELGEALATRLHESDAFLLANHGVVVLGSTLPEAADVMDELEETAKLAVLLSGKNARYFSSAEIEALLQ